LSKLIVSGLYPVAQGITRPEDVLLFPDGRVLASDEGSAVAVLDPDGTVRRIGQAGGSPNGLGALPNGKVAVANFELGSLQEVDLVSGAVRVIASETTDGVPLRYANYPLVDAHGGIWLSCCTVRDDITAALAIPEADGLLVYVDPAGSARVVTRLVFPNCMASDASGHHLYVCRTATTDVVRFPILGPGVLGPEESFGPPLGGRGADEVGPEYQQVVTDPVIARRWGLADGCAFDADGNLWVTLVMSNSIVAITPAGERIDVDLQAEEGLVQAPTSICWAGPDMCDVYIGSLAAPYVLRGRSSIPGVARFSA
jgi:sugar lactone lactonase YvrE